MKPVEAFRRSAEQFEAALRQVGNDQWQRPTPCTEWSVRGLVNHVVGENLWMPPLLGGQTIGEVGSRFDGDVLGSDPVQAWESARADAAAAVSDEAALARTVALSFGETEASEYVWQVAADQAIHAWDLAVAVGADDRLDAALVTAVATWFADNEEGYRAGGAIGPRPALDAAADEQTRLLAMFGRTRPVADAGRS